MQWELTPLSNLGINVDDDLSWSTTIFASKPTLEIILLYIPPLSKLSHSGIDLVVKPSQSMFDSSQHDVKIMTQAVQHLSFAVGRRAK